MVELGSWEVRKLGSREVRKSGSREVRKSGSGNVSQSKIGVILKIGVIKREAKNWVNLPKKMGDPCLFDIDLPIIFVNF